jgi:hypothetical protein
MSLFFTDKIKIVTITTDDNGVVTETEGTAIPARVEDFNDLIIDSRGQETFAEMIIFFDPSFNISNADKIIITKKYGQAYPESTKKWKVKKSPVVHGFNAHHREIYI